MKPGWIARATAFQTGWTRQVQLARTINPDTPIAQPEGLNLRLRRSFAGRTRSPFVYAMR
jgi:hypothetical protein